MNGARLRRLIAHPSPWFVLLGALGSLGAMQWHVDESRRETQRALNQANERIADSVERRMELYQYGLRGARGAVITVGEQGIDYQTFLRYAKTREVDLEFPGARGFGFIRRVPEESLQSFVERARLQRPDFSVRELAPHEGAHYVIEFIEPSDRNQAAIGLDIGSESNRRQAAERAMREGRAIATAPITLVQASGEIAQGLLVLMPVYRTVSTPESLAERELDAVGWSYAPLLMSEVLADIDRGFSGVHIEIVDEAHARQSDVVQPLFESPNRASNPTASASVRREIFGRTWRVDAHALGEFKSSLNLGDPRKTLLSGLLATILLALLAEAVNQARQRRRELTLEQQRMSEIVAHASDAMFGESPEGRITFWNPAAERLFGFAAAQALGRPLSEFAGALTQAGPRDHGDPGEKTIELPDGRRLEVQLSRSAILDAERRIRGYSCVVHDVSQRKDAERRLRNFNERLEALVSARTRELDMMRRELQLVLDSVPQLIASWDHALCCRVANRASSEWFSNTAMDPVGQPMEQLWGSDFKQKLAPFIELAQSGQAVEFELELDAVEGEHGRKTQWRLIPERQHDRLWGFLAVAVDVTEVTQQRDALERERSRLAETARTLQSVLRAASEVSIIATDVAGTVILFNTGAERMLGYSASDIVGRLGLPELIDPIELERQASALAELHGTTPTVFQALVSRAEREGAETREWHYIARSGKLIEVSQTVTAMRDEDGSAVGYLSVARDITESRRAEQAKSTFVATVSHELRTPLTVITGSLDLVSSGALGAISAEASELLQAAQVNSRRLGLLINDLLDVEKLAAGMMVFEPESLDVGQAVDTAVESTRDYLFDRKVEIEVQANERALTIRADPLRFSQVLVNLLSNAIKFSPPGQPVQVRWFHNQGDVLISVRDHGPGIPEAFRARVFERFSQADHSDRRRQGGTGLGLAISRDLLHGMGGSIWFEDAPGGGTCFWIKIEGQES